MPGGSSFGWRAGKFFVLLKYFCDYESVTSIERARVTRVEWGVGAFYWKVTWMMRRVGGFWFQLSVTWSRIMRNGALWPGAMGAMLRGSVST